jgi:hypothetical protein
MTRKVWRIEYDNDTGPGDEGFCEWWNVTDGEATFRTHVEEDAKWLKDVLDAAWMEVKR